MSALHEKITDEVEKSLRERNEQQAKAAIEALGKKYLLHPANAIKISRKPLYLQASSS